MGEDVDTGGDVFGRGIFIGVMGKAVAAADENHGDGHHGGEDDAIVTGSTWDDSFVASDGGERTEELVSEAGFAVGGVVALDNVPSECEAARVGDDGEGILDFELGFVPNVVIGVADVDSEGHFLWDAVRDVGLDFGLPHGGDEGGGGLRYFLDGEDGFGGSSEGVASHRHGGGAGVVSVAGEGDEQASLPHDAGDNAGGLIGLLEYAALFDMKLDVAEGEAGVVLDDFCLVVPTGGSEDEGERLTVSVLTIESAVVEFTNDAAAAKIGGLKADPFLVGEGENVDWERKGDVLLGEDFESGEGTDDAEGTIVFSRINDGVDVGTKKEGLGVGIAAGEDAAHGAVVGVGGGHAELFHPVNDRAGGS